MDSISNDFGDVLLWSLWFFIWIAAIMVWVRCLFDMFGDHTLSGWAKAGWAVLLIFVPWVGALIYLIARGRSMTERQIAAAKQHQAAQADYIRDVAGASGNPCRADRRRQEAARLRCHRRGRVPGAEGQGPGLTPAAGAQHREAGPARVRPRCRLGRRAAERLVVDPRAGRRAAGRSGRAGAGSACSAGRPAWLASCRRPCRTATSVVQCGDPVRPGAELRVQRLEGEVVLLPRPRVVLLGRLQPLPEQADLGARGTQASRARTWPVGPRSPPAASGAAATRGCRARPTAAADPAAGPSP